MLMNDFLPSNKRPTPPNNHQPTHQPDLSPKQPGQSPVTTINEEPMPKNNQTDKQFDQIRMTSYHPGSRSAPPKKPKTNRFWYDKRWSPKRKLVFWVYTTLIIAGLLFGGWYAYRIISGASGIFTGNYLDLLRGRQPLERDQFGRSNVLVFGTTEDGERGGFDLLTDSILVVSIDQDTKQGNMISIPRDLWVEYNQQCPNGTAGKVNAIYSCGIQNGLSELAASEAFADIISEVIGTDIQYVTKVNQVVLRQVVDTLGGIEVTIESPDPRGIFDVATGLELPNGPVTIDGETALDLSRARNAKGGYGLPRSNFDREQNQQKIIRAIQREALSTGTLANPNRVIGLAESLGDNVITNLPSRQIRTVIDIARNANADAIETIDIANGDTQVVTTGQQFGQSIVLPIAGLYNYSEIHELIHQKFQPPPEPVTFFPQPDSAPLNSTSSTTRSLFIPANAEL